MGDWFLEIEDATGDALGERLGATHVDPPAARARARRLHDNALCSDRKMIAAVAGASATGYGD